MEARLYAEDPANGFLPSIGKLDHFVMPEGIRVDTGVEQGGEVSQFYDPMIAKLIAHAASREEAAAALADACAEVEVWPVRTNAGFLVRCLEHPRFVSGDVDTGFIATEEDDLARPPLSDAALAGVARFIRVTMTDGAGDRSSPWSHFDDAVGFRLNAAPSLAQTVFIEGERFTADEADFEGYSGSIVATEADELVAFEDGVGFVISRRSSAQTGSGPASDGSLRAPMPGKIVATPARPGDVVTKGQPVVVLEAMKMEHALVAPFDGVVGEIGVAVGDQVTADTVLAVVKANDQ